MQGLLSATGDITSVKVKQELQAQIALLQAQINELKGMIENDSFDCDII